MGALYCLSCGASSPTAISDTVPESRPGTPRLSIDVEGRRTEVQAALGDGLRVRGLIGRGGFGEVWAALDVALGRQVAVKVLRPELYATPAFRERFQKEARAIARLRHPGIVPIYHVGESNGLLYFTMPLVQGVTLKALLSSPAR